MHEKTLRSLLALGLMAPSLALTACGPAAVVDAGTDAPVGDAPPATPDTPRDAPAAAGTCDDVRTQALTVGTTTITGNTTGRGSTLTLTCGNDPSPQEAVQLTVPGTSSEMYGLRLSLVNDGTADTFDTILEVRATCDDDTDAVCNDDANPPAETRSAVQLLVPGGASLVAIVTGYAADNVGPWAIEAEVVANVQPPTLTGGSALLQDADRVRATVMGTDPNGDAVGLIVEFLDAAGTAIAADIDMDVATPDVSEFRLPFADDVTGMMTFTTEGRGVGFGDFPTLVAATQLRVRITDEWDLESAPMTFALTAATSVALGEACDATHLCPDALACEAMVCAIPAAALAACADATAVTLVAPTGSTRSAMTLDGTIAVGEGGLIAPCQADSAGAELLYTVTVPAGMNDLVVSTAGTRTGMADTVAYVMTTCGDTSADPETYCHDDVTYPDDVSSVVEIQNVAAGDYTVAVELYQPDPITAAVNVGTTIALRPVLATGAACDPMGIENRCSAGACPAAMVCP